MRGRKAAPPAERIRSKSEVTEDGCWQWTGAQSNRGYAEIVIRWNGRVRTMSAHRVAYETFVGPIPDGLVIDHLCRNRMCVNPEHLEAVSQRENVMRSPIAVGALNAKKTHCPQGHPYSPENTHVYERPNTTMRICKTCAASRRDRAQAKQVSA